MRRTDEREIKIARKSAISGFVVASILLIAFILYNLVIGRECSSLLIIGIQSSCLLGLQNIL